MNWEITASRILTKVENFVTRKPLTTVGIAALAILLLLISI